MSVAQLDVSIGKPLPQNPEAERSVLGSILIDNQAFYRVIGHVREEDFYKDQHRLIFATMAKLATASREIDILTIKDDGAILLAQ